MKHPDFPKKNIRNLDEIGYVLPSSLAAIIIFLAIILDVLFGDQLTGNKSKLPFAIGIIGCVYVILQILIVVPRVKTQNKIYIWINACISGIGIGLFTLVLGNANHTFFSVLLILAVSASSILSERHPTYLLIAISGFFYIYAHREDLTLFLNWIIHFIPIIASIVVTETILRLRGATLNHIRRLEIINFFSQQIISSLKTDQVLTILNAALQKALAADTYFVGLADKDNINLELFYDDGEYFEGIKVPLKGSLSGWVIENGQPLFISDLRQDIHLNGAQRIPIGKNKSALSWMGVPMKATNINGLLAVASYKANAFSTSDFELLWNMAHHAALALDNTMHHKLVEEQSQLDSLTGTFNHRHFLEVLQDQIDTTHLSIQVLSLIMLDIDYFKSYNDAFGHQVGDTVLQKLCKAIQNNIKKDDFVGRWGGEEFAIALPGANGAEAHQVALRIQESMQNLDIGGTENEPILAPTVSQGIAVFPAEANNIERFIYLADQRLYKAKERGRNQIEPDPSHWASPHL